MHDTKLRHHQYTLVTPDVVFSTVELEHMKSSSPCREQVFLRVGACRNRVPYISTVVVVVVVVVVVATHEGSVAHLGADGVTELHEALGLLQG